MSEERAMVRNAADKEQVEKAAIKERVTAKVRLDDFAGLMQSQSFRRFLYHLINNVCGLQEESYTGASESTFYTEGKRRVGAGLNQEAMKHPELYIAMLKEAMQAEQI